MPQYYTKVVITDITFSEIRALRGSNIVTVTKMNMTIVFLFTVGHLKLQGGGCFWWHDFPPKFYSDFSIASKIISEDETSTP
jgi:hypothetical protein